MFGIALLMPALCTPDAYATEGESTYHQAFRTLHERGQFNGAVLIAKGDDVLLDDHFGIADASEDKALASDSLYRLASVSKTITATALLTLVDAGTLSLDDEVRTHLPAFPYERITVRHLLQHSSGLPDYIFGIEGYGPDSKGPRTNQGVLDWLAEKKPAPGFDPGKGWEYSNTGYALIPLLIEKVASRAYPDYVRQAILDKAGMRDSYHLSELGEAERRRVARGHGFDYASGTDRRVDQHPVFATEFNADGISGAGDMYSTTRDLLRFHRALDAGALISPAQQQAAYTSMMLPEGFPAGYGLGWQVAESDLTGRVIHHHGLGEGYRTRFYRFPDKGIVIITLQNARELYADDAVRVAQQLVFKDTYSLPLLSLAEALSRTMSKDGLDATLAQVDAATKAPGQWALNQRDLNNFAFTFWYQGKRETAIRLLTRYTTLTPNDPAVYMTLGEALGEERKTAESLGQYRRALEIANADPKKYARELREIKEVLGTRN
jgi:CubicO group peptidase (beta-lactamase class C family)